MSRTSAQMLAEANARVSQVSPEDAAAELAAGTAMLLDVREPIEWAQGVPGSVQLPRGLLEFQADPASARHNAAFDPERRIIVFCRSGARSALAAATLLDLGFTDVANLVGGFTAWQAAGLPVLDQHEGL